MPYDVFKPSGNKQSYRKSSVNYRSCDSKRIMPTKSNICASTLTIVNILLSAFTHITTEVQALRQANLHCLQVRTELRVQYSVTAKEQVTRTLSPLHLICSVKVSTLNFILKILMKSSKYTKSIIVCRSTQDTHTQVKWQTLHSQVLTRTQSKRVWINSVQSVK